MSSNSITNVYESSEGNINKGNGCIDLTGDDSQEYLKTLEGFNQSSSFNSNCVKRTPGIKEVGYEEDTNSQSGSKVVSFFYSGKLNKPIVVDSLSNKKSTEDVEHTRSKEYSINKLKCWSNESSLSKACYESVKNNDGKNSSYPNGNESEMNTDHVQQIQLNNNSTDSRSTLDIVSRIQSDFLDDTSSDEEAFENKITAESDKSSNEINTDIKAEPLGKSLTDLGKKLKVRRISSDFFDDSSLNEEDFLGTDEELDMKDNFFNGFQEISENNQIKNRRFRQFLNRISESENEEWYVNAGNLSMDVRKDSSLCSKSLNLKSNMEYNSLRSNGEKTTVIIVDEDSNKEDNSVKPLKEYNDSSREINKVKATYCNSNFQVSEESGKQTHDEINNTYSHGKATSGAKLNKKYDQLEIGMKKKIDQVDNLSSKERLFVSSSKDSSVKFSSLETNPTKSLKISLSFEKLDVFSKNIIETNCLQRTEEDMLKKTIELSKVNTNNNSNKLIENILEKKELTSVVEEEAIVIEDSPETDSCNNKEKEVGKRYNSEDELKHKSGNTANSHSLQCHLKSKNNHKSDGMVTCNNSVIDLIENTPRKRNPSHEEINADNQYCEMKKNYLKENKLILGTAATISEPDSHKVNTGGGTSKDIKSKKLDINPFLGSRLQPNKLMPRPEFTDELLTSVTDDIPRLIVSSTPEKGKQETQSGTPAGQNSSPWKDDSEQNFKSCDDSTDSDDEPLSVIQKSCSLSGSPALFSMKETVVTEGFSPHNNNTHENNLEGDKVDERKIAHCDTAADLTETDAIGRNKVNSNVSENIKAVNIHESKILTKKRGRKSKGDQDEGKSKKMPEISGKDGMVKTRKGHKGNFEESSTSISISDIAIYNCSESEELRINSPALDNFAKLEKIEFQESPSQPKRRGRPPKRKINEMNSMASKEVNRKINQINSVVSKEVDGNTLYDPIYGDELLLSIYSEEVESILVGGLKGSGDCKSQSKAVFSEPPSNNESKQVVNTDSSGVSPQTQHCPQKNTLPCEAVVPKKRGRKPKLKLESSSLVLQPETANSVRSGEVLKDIETKENDLVKDSLVENPCDSVITVPKKRGRKPKLKSQIFYPIVTSETDKSIITHDLLGKETESEKSNCNSSEVKVPKKRGRKPKLKLDISSTEHKESDRDESSVTSDKQISLSRNVPDQPENSNLCDLSVGVIKADSNGEEKVIISKKRGRKPGNQIKYDLSMNQKSANLEIEATNILEKRGRRYCRNSTLNIKEEKSGTDNNKNISTTRRKSAKLNSDINDTGSEASSVLEFCVKDRDCNSSVTSELLGTDVIFINEEKLNSSHPSTKRGRKRKKLEVVEDDSHDFEPDKYSSGNDSDDSNSKEQSVKPKKRRKVDTDDDYSNEGEETDKKDKRKMGSRSSATKKTSVNSNERIFFRTKHRSSDKVVCGTCKEEMSFTNYRKHHSIFKHYMLSWLEGEENPLDLNDEKDVVNRLWFAKKRIGKTPFRCFVCNIPKLSAVGFYSHIRFCGKDSEEKESMLVTCEVCGARLMPSSFKPHMYIKHNSRPSASGSNLEQMDSSLIVKGRRAAATRAVEVIQQRLIDDQELEGPNSRPSSPERKPHLNHLYLKPTKNVPPQEYQRWKDSLTETMVVKCTMPGCDFSANTTIHFRKHYLTCPFSPPRPYKCRVCTFTSLTLDPMVEHVEENHVDKTFSQPYGSENESSDESDGEHRHSKAVYYGTNLPFKFLKLVKMQNPRAKWPNRKRFFTAALDWTLKLRQSIFATETLYPSAQPCADDWKTAEMASSHLPELTQSIRFQGKDGTWRSLQRFHGTVVDDVPVLFAGGPVWATAWAPVPYPEEHQYLAVAPHTSVELTHKMASVYNYPGLIQVWTLGSLNNTDDGGACSPSLVFGLAHQRGPVWDLAWCPAGACSQERLGLLAAAFGDGSVVVYAVPRITQAADEPLSCCFSVEPVLELKLGCEMMSQCTCIDWHAAAPHSMIVGGFANGMVALWNLTTTSPLLKNGNTILPFKVIEAHLSAVTAVRLSWAKEDVHLMTASLDRATKFWRLNDTTSPVNALRKASVTDAVMPNNWLLSISAYDDVYSINSSHITGCSYRETFSTTNNNYILQPGTVWSLSFNDWLNGCACASEMGKVNAFFRQQLLVTEDSKKVNKSAFMEELVSCSALSIRDGSTVTSGFGPLYNDCASNVGLAFNFGGNVKGGKPASACSSDNMDSFPVRSFNTVSWNPNLSSFTWLAAGMQNGLVVVPKIKSVHADDLADLYNKHKDNL